MIENIKFNHHGLVPAIVQDFNTKRVLMLAYMNEDSVKKSLETKTTWFYSRSRKELWNKGATSGNVQAIVNMSYDCDGDAVLCEVIQTGVACHTGEYSCFFNKMIETEQEPFSIYKLYDLIIDRKANPIEGSYTNYLFEKGIDKMLKKVGEETAEVIIGAKNEGTDELRYEIADLIYHLMVLMAEKGLKIEEVGTELAKRLK